MVRAKHSRPEDQQEQGTEESRECLGNSKGTCVGCGAGWWQIKEVPELPEKRVWVLSEARGRQWSNTSSAALQEGKSVSNFKMYWRLQSQG